MKAFLLTAAALMACAGSMFAQNLPPDYTWEVGVNGGISVATRPLGPAINYQGTRTNPVRDLSLRLNYYINPNWMLNLDIGDRQWKSFGTWQLVDEFGQKLQARQVSFLIADHAINESVGINYVIPFYAKYSNYNKSNLYFGVNVGMITTTNDNSIGYSKYNAPPDSNYTYVSSYDYGFGVGYSFGVQMGYTWYLTPHLGFNVDLGVRYAHVGTNDTHYDGENSKFYLLYFPETFGLRWKF